MLGGVFEARVGCLWRGDGGWVNNAFCEDLLAILLRVLRVMAGDAGQMELFKFELL